MGLPGIRTLFFCLSWMFVGRVEAEPHYMAVIPAVIEAGADTTFCVNLLRPGESLLINISLISRNTATLLLQTTSSDDFHTCVHFQAPSVQKNEVVDFKVEVKGATFHSEEIRKVKIRVSRPMTFIQTDKPIYLPGQTVHFRVVTLDTKLRPANQLYNVIEIQDSDHNRIRQWLNTTSSSKILQLSHSLNSEAREGTYRVTVWINGDKTDQHFKVEKYVLPKFDVEVKAKDEISIGQEEIRVDVCAKYTFGQSVPGTVELQMCQRGWQHYGLFSGEDLLEPPDRTTQCVKETKQTEKDGCTTFMVAMSTFTTIEPNALRNILHLSARVEEEGTGILLSREKTVSLSYFIGKLFFIDTPNVYNQGSILEAKVKAVHFNDTPIPDKLVYLVEFTGISEHDHVIQNLTTDSDGIATFTLDTTGHIGNIQLKATFQQNQEQAHRTPRYQNGYHRLFSVQPSSPHSVSASSLKVTSRETPLVCDKEETISVHYTIVGETPGCVDVMYLILSRGAIVMQGLKTVEVRNSSVTEGEVSFTLKVSPEMAPYVQVVAYAVLPSETVMAHSADFSTEKCFSNKVSLEFSPSSAVPGEETTLTLTAQPNSLCGVSAVDQSVLIQEPGQTLDADKIFNLLPVKKGSSFQDDIEDPVQCLNVRQKGSVFPCCGRGRKSDAYFLFKNVGLKVATNLLIRRPLCEEYEYFRPIIQYRMATEAIRAGSGMRFGGVPETEMVTVRTFFPETWIWDLVEVGESGTAAVSFTVPDTITTWETETFCLSSQGFGLAPRKQLTVFQPFFLELTLPYSVIRGEHFELKATVFNYLSSCIMVSVTAAPSSDYTLTPLSGDLYTSCLCASERKTLSWTMIPSVIGVMNVTVTAEAVASHVSCDNEVVSVPDRGRIDVVTRPLIVKAEGIEETQTYNWLLCPKDQNCQSDCPALHAESLTEEIELQLPENVIDGSARASVSVLGDILGRALRNLDGLLTMPYGCGEQNMALLAPNIYILQYLKNTQQLTAAIEEKAFNFLTGGYQRQLGYEHLDGAYSTFGRGVGNTWLTAFVLRCFVKAQSFVYIDPAKIAHSKTWLESKQRENGCFELSGKLFHNRMKGGVSDEVTLSAYITAAFLEMNMSRTHHVVQRSLSCLSESISDLNNTYTTALLAYVFTLAGDMETRAHLLKHLDTVSSQQGGFLHWSQTAAETSASLSVEISSYVLLAKLSASPTAEDLSYATRIVRWLTGQQNHYGGFSSTQDTVVALQALALYSTLVFSPESSGSVTVQSPSGQLTFVVNRDNKLLYQEEALEEVTGRFSLEVKGTACAAVQIFLHYNIPTPDNFSNLHVVVVPSDDCSPQRHKFILFLQSVYTGKENSTNMVILDIKMLSGFVPDPESLKKLRSGPMVDRVDQNEDHVVVYIQELQKYSPIDHRLALIQEHPVQNLKPAVVKIYDYYQPSDQYETEYTDRCAAA